MNVEGQILGVNFERKRQPEGKGQKYKLLHDTGKSLKPAISELQLTYSSNENGCKKTGNR